MSDAHKQALLKYVYGLLVDNRVHYQYLKGYINALQDTGAITQEEYTSLRGSLEMRP